MSSETRRETAPRPVAADLLLTPKDSVQVETLGSRARGHHEQTLGIGT